MHADSSPDAVAKWYHDHSYHFLVLSEHNIFIDPATVNLPADRRDNFLLIAGEEITGKRNVHSTAMNIPSLVDWEFEGDSVAAVIQKHLNNTKAIGGEHILNHPTYKFAVTADDIAKAIAEGRFYSTSGVMLTRLERSSSAYDVEVDVSATIDAVSSP